MASSDKCTHVDVERMGVFRSWTLGRRHNTNHVKKVEKFTAHSWCRAHERESQPSESGDFSLVEGSVGMAYVLKGIGSAQLGCSDIRETGRKRLVVGKVAVGKSMAGRR